ncbi:hypothetical protein D6783_03905 [Candidatus Woesearchaeota archaeon]|nr:MAG: hypothetical protein D6783_03905 [Candidatus Woesearchaeota archaeon]
MSTIAGKDFHKTMDDYLSKVHKKREQYTKPKRKLFHVEIKEDDITKLEDSQVHVFKREPSWLDRLFRRSEPVETEELDEDLTPEELEKLKKMEEEIEQSKKRAKQEHMTEAEEEAYEETLLTRFFNYLKGARRRQRYIEELEEAPVQEHIYIIPEDVKDVLKLLNKWLNKLSKRNLESFKKSPDFQRYKAVLEKYDLVKKKTKKNQTKSN